MCPIRAVHVRMYDTSVRWSFVRSRSRSLAVGAADIMWGGTSIVGRPVVGQCSFDLVI